MSDKQDLPADGAPSETASGGERGPQITIKKYANRRLYNTATSSYVTLEHLCAMVKEGVEFVVYDAKSGEDITRSVLTQIIVEEEAKGSNMLPIPFLRQLISFYGGSMQPLVPRYLEHMMQSFAENQDRLRQQMQDTMSGMFPFSGNLGEMGKHNAQFFENAMKMFTPFAPPGKSGQSGPTHPGSARPGSAQPAAPRADEPSRQPSPEAPPAPPAKAAPQAKESLERLKQQFDQLQQQLDALTRQQTPPAPPAKPAPSPVPSKAAATKPSPAKATPAKKPAAPKAAAKGKESTKTGKQPPKAG